jgi:hypothetical protein
MVHFLRETGLHLGLLQEIGCLKLNEVNRGRCCGGDAARCTPTAANDRPAPMRKQRSAPTDTWHEAPEQADLNRAASGNG